MSLMCCGSVLKEIRMSLVVKSLKEFKKEAERKYGQNLSKKELQRQWEWVKELGLVIEAPKKK